ncbi:restriction endonuclease subunit S [uncultured Brachyspira sp.]|uniref:restriction endonuclease subunit S n=1 Tax=uncultured Brachyspira sp. TaxID=221953 RepID=UPI00260A51EA|nr:restriction endonuclease subunit S [uncultured Brachyspira sp.]
MKSYPADWQEVKLENILLYSFYGTSLPSSETGKYPILKMNNMDNGNIILNKLSYIDLTDDEFNKIKLKKGDILFNRTNSYELVGKISLFNMEEDYTIASYIVALRPNQDIVNPIFLNNILNTKYYKNQISKLISKGVSQCNINPTSLKKNIVIILPPLDEQKRIASVLSLCDEAIENLNKLIYKKELYKKGVMQRVLTGEERFEGFTDEWIFKPLEKLCNIKKGEQKNKLDLIENGKYPVLSGGMDFSGYYNLYNREANTITISEGGNSCGYVNFIKTKFWASGHCYTLHDVNIDSLFLYQCLKYNESKIMKLRLGSGLPNIQLSYIKEYTLKIPKSIEEQNKIASFLSTIDEDIDNIKKLLELRKEQKKGLMQRLLTGEIRI